MFSNSSSLDLLGHCQQFPIRVTILYILYGRLFYKESMAPLSVFAAPWEPWLTIGKPLPLALGPSILTWKPSRSPWNQYYFIPNGSTFNFKMSFLTSGLLDILDQTKPSCRSPWAGQWISFLVHVPSSLKEQPPRGDIAKFPAHRRCHTHFVIQQSKIPAWKLRELQLDRVNILNMTD